jgi:hypothetical protein
MWLCGSIFIKRKPNPAVLMEESSISPPAISGTGFPRRVSFTKTHRFFTSFDKELVQLIKHLRKARAVHSFPLQMERELESEVENLDSKKICVQ